MAAPQRTPFHDFHVSAGARMVEFAGWELPVLYRSIADEHAHTRASGGIFDVSHMGRLRFTGADAGAFLEWVCTRRLGDLLPTRGRYALVCDARGMTMDDVIVTREAKAWSMVCNASNRAKLLAHFAEVKSARGFQFEIEDQTESTGMVAVQGPRAVEKLAGALGEEVAELKKFQQHAGRAMLIPFTASRSGYTGEDGLEVTLPAKAASMALRFLAGKLDRPDATLRPAGLGARDTLRLEAALPLYGHELTPETDPIGAGLGWAVTLDKEFLGAEPLRAVAASGPRRKLVGLTLEGRRIARQDQPVLVGGNVVGAVTSGTFGPTVNASIALAYVEAEHAAVGTSVDVDFRGSGVGAKVTALPFYKRPATQG